MQQKAWYERGFKGLIHFDVHVEGQNSERQRIYSQYNMSQYLLLGSHEYYSWGNDPDPEVKAFCSLFLKKDKDQEQV
ncbi:MAG: hypothetical protein AB7F43_13100 [Bacteriovoracia bacterium]